MFCQLQPEPPQKTTFCQLQPRSLWRSTPNSTPTTFPQLQPGPPKMISSCQLQPRRSPFINSSQEHHIRSCSVNSSQNPHRRPTSVNSSQDHYIWPPFVNSSHDIWMSGVHLPSTLAKNTTEDHVLSTPAKTPTEDHLLSTPAKITTSDHLLSTQAMTFGCLGCSWSPSINSSQEYHRRPFLAGVDGRWSSVEVLAKAYQSWQGTSSLQLQPRAGRLRRSGLELTEGGPLYMSWLKLINKKWLAVEVLAGVTGRSWLESIDMGPLAGLGTTPRLWNWNSHSYPECEGGGYGCHLPLRDGISHNGHARGHHDSSSHHKLQLFRTIETDSGQMFLIHHDLDPKHILFSLHYWTCFLFLFYVS